MSDAQDEQDLYSTLKDLNNPKNPDSPLQDNFQNSMLYKTLLQQTMANQPQSGFGGILSKLMGTFMSTMGSGNGG